MARTPQRQDNGRGHSSHPNKKILGTIPSSLREGIVKKTKSKAWVSLRARKSAANRKKILNRNGKRAFGKATTQGTISYYLASSALF